MKMKQLMVGAIAIVGMTGAMVGTAGSAPYGQAGCGLGSMLLGSEAGFKQVFAATTNGTFGTQTFGITSGTSNCGPRITTAQGTRTYIEGNREALAKDIARGGGETIVGLAAMAGCADAGTLGSTLQSSYEQIFPTAGVSDAAVSDAIIQTIAPLQCTAFRS